MVIAAGIILDIAYGYTVHSHEDDFMRFADEATSATASVTPAAMAVDFFPIRTFNQQYTGNR